MEPLLCREGGGGGGGGESRQKGAAGGERPHCGAPPDGEGWILRVRICRQGRTIASRSREITSTRFRII